MNWMWTVIRLGICLGVAILSRQTVLTEVSGSTLTGKTDPCYQTNYF